MKDTEARDRIAKLEQALAALPAQVSEVVLAHIEPTIAQVNTAITAMNQQSEHLESLAEAVARLEGSSSHELFEVIESELNTLRVDVNASREATAAVATEVATVGEKLARVGKVFAELGWAPHERR